jgi:hypothetical protein
MRVAKIDTEQAVAPWSVPERGTSAFGFLCCAVLRLIHTVTVNGLAWIVLPRLVNGDRQEIGVSAAATTWAGPARQADRDGRPTPSRWSPAAHRGPSSSTSGGDRRPQVADHAGMSANARGAPARWSGPRR